MAAKSKKSNKLFSWPRRLLSNKRRLAVIVVLIAVGAFIYFRFTKKTVGTETYQVRRDTLTVGLTANGQVESTTFADLKFLSPGKVAWVGVKKGDKVQVGEAVAKLDTVILNSNYEQALNNLRNAQANVESVLDSVQGHENDETYAMRAKRTAAQVERDNAYEQVVSARKALSNATIVSPISGVVVETNDLIAGLDLTGADLESKYIRVVDPSTLYFKADVDEIDYKNISVGQQTDLVFDSYPGETCHGSVEEIDKESQEQVGGVVTVPTKVKFEYCFLDLVTGFNGQANFIKDKAVNVLSIPKKYLVDQNGQTYVYLMTGNTAQEYKLVPVQTGLESSSEVEITSGLNEGDTIVFVPTS